jgi:hypothetical protein
MAAGQVNGAAIIDLPLLKSGQDAAKRKFRLTTTAHTCRPCRARGCVCVCVCVRVRVRAYVWKRARV